MSTSTPLGPGTMSIGLTAESLTDFTCEILGGHVTHAYEEVGSTRTMLCGTPKPASKVRTDGLAFSVENDLTASGLYSFLQTNDLATAFFEYMPNNTSTAQWAGQIGLSLPPTIGADEHGQPIVSEVEWTGVGKFEFTPAPAAP